MKVGFVGAGNMAAAMARGWAAAEGGPETMLFADLVPERAASLAGEVGGQAVTSNAELVSGAELVVLAVKPGALDAVAGDFGAGDAAVLSILGATALERLQSALPGRPVMRIIPNVAVEVGRGVMCFAPGSDVPDELASRVRSLLECLGIVVDLDERLIDAATAVMSCAPAYVALVAEALADAGVQAGLDARSANRLVVETLAGTAALLRDRDTLGVRRAVTSPGGSTAAGLAALERGGVRAAFADAVRSSLERMRG